MTQNRIVLITGAAWGIGSGFVKRFLRDGGTVIATDKIRGCVRASIGTPAGAGLTVSAAFDRLAEKRSKLDPLRDGQHVEDVEAYERLSKLSPSKLDSLIDLLVVDRITAHQLRPTPLVARGPSRNPVICEFAGICRRHSGRPATTKPHFTSFRANSSFKIWRVPRNSYTAGKAARCLW
jgi:NAD(P)-dependent dehydrogenase (short-subunit alcohol dehydrogenase family)